MKKIIAFATLLTLCLGLLVGCVGGDGVTTFNQKDVAAKDLLGLGVDWGVYEDVNKLSSDSEARVLSAVNRLNPRLVRCMTNLDWLAYDLDDKGNDDPSDDEWKYDFDNKYMYSTCKILDWCQENAVKVAFGVWNVIGNANAEVDVWKMIPNSTSDIRWAKMIADLLEYLVKIKGYDCIKWFVNTNEPNYVGNVGSSKNAYNTFEKWSAGVRNVRAALDGVGLDGIAIVGGDVTAGGTGFSEYLLGIADGMTDVVDNYGVHLYVSNHPLDTGTFYNQLTESVDALRQKDSKVCNDHRVIIWESGLLDGKNAVLDSNGYIANFSYGIRMTDFTLQSLLAGASGICYWDLDDAMHFMYTENGATAKEWGMFSTLATASALKQEIRPWFHSSTLLTNLLLPGNTVYSTADYSETFRALATVSADGKSGGIVAVNRGVTDVEKTFRVQAPIESDGKLYVYVFNEKNLRLGQDGYVVPNAVIDGDLNQNVKLTLPANSAVFVSTYAL